MLITTLMTVAGLTAGAALWTLAEYVLHRFAMHERGGRGIMSREHLEHHVTSSWHFDRNLPLSWAGILAVGFGVVAPLLWWSTGPAVGLSVATGWTLGYFHYEARHAGSHLRAPRSRYTAWLRRHHFHHHFGHPLANHGVTTAAWDKVFGTYERPTIVRVPRRLALPWLLDEDGRLRSEFADDYVLVGSADRNGRTAALDRARAFASAAPTD